MRTPPQTEVALTARAEASAWITRLHGPNRSPEMEAGLRRWLGERPENAREFEGLTEIWDIVAGGAPARGAPRLERWEQSEEARELLALRTARICAPSPSSVPQMRAWARVALVLLVLGAALGGAYQLWSPPTYSTAVGEQRIMQLPDGTRVSLNSDSLLTVDFSGTQRRLRLERGEVLFEVAKDVHRPFVVEAGAHRVRALGTSFVVRKDAHRTSIILVEGKIAVAEEGRTKSAVGDTVLVPGQRMTIAGERGAVPKMDTPRIEAVTAWRRGEVVLDDTALADAVVEMNRYDATAIVIDSPKIAGLIVSGLYHTGDSEGFARSVAAMYQLQVIERNGRIHLKK